MIATMFLLIGLSLPGPVDPAIFGNPELYENIGYLPVNERGGMLVYKRIGEGDPQDAYVVVGVAPGLPPEHMLLIGWGYVYQGEEFHFLRKGGEFVRTHPEGEEKTAPAPTSKKSRC